MSASEEVKVGVELTPNPNALKFVVNRELLPMGTVFFETADKAKGSPLAESLFAVSSVENLMFGRDFVTITKKEQSDWETSVPDIFHALKSSLEKDKPWVREDLIPKPSSGSQDEIEQKIIDILDREIRPAVARDGGDIIFSGYHNGIVQLHLQGACSSCPSSIMTLKMGVETRLKQLIPEIREVVQI